MTYQLLVHLSCRGCGRVFFADRFWWAERLLSGAPPLRCRDCTEAERSTST